MPINLSRHGLQPQAPPRALPVPQLQPLARQPKRLIPRSVLVHLRPPPPHWFRPPDTPRTNFEPLNPPLPAPRRHAAPPLTSPSPFAGATSHGPRLMQAF